MPDKIFEPLSQTAHDAYRAVLQNSLVNSTTELSKSAKDLLDKARKLQSGTDSNPVLQPLQSVLENIGQEEVTASKYFYEPNALSLEEGSVFPTKETQLLNDQILVAARASHEKLQEGDSYTLFHWLFKYGSRVSTTAASTSDVSLFDYNRVLGATICCLDKQEDEQFCLIKGDISGIQKFIYSDINLEKVQDTQDLSKRLRGRSFYVALLTEFVAEQLVQELHLMQANIIFAGGGQFIILAPNAVRDRLDAFERRINQQLLQRVGNDLDVVLATVDCDESVFENFEQFSVKLNTQLERIKRRRHWTYVDDYFNVESPKPKFNDDVRLGEKVPYAEYLLEVGMKNGGKLDETNLTVQSFADSSVYYHLLAGTKNFRQPDKQLEEIYTYLAENQNKLTYARIIRLNNTNFLPDVPLPKEITIPVSFGFKFIGKAAPNYEDYKQKKWDNDESLHRGNNIVAFTDLAEINHADREGNSLSYAQLGVLRLDVDDLGAIFSFGLNPASFARVASLSREMQLFFSGYFNVLADKYCCYVTYSGGDDAFVVGSWFNAIHFAEAFKRAFDRFTCHNDLVSFSTGIFMCNPHYPVGRFADDAAELEESSKKFPYHEKVVKEEKKDESKKQPTKNAVTIFNHTVHWNRFTEMLAYAGNMERLIAKDGENEAVRKGQKIRRSMVQRLLSIIKSSHTNREGIEFYQNVARLHYLFARNGYNQKRMRTEAAEKQKSDNTATTDLHDMIEDILRNFAQQEAIRDYVIPANYVLYKTRSSTKKTR